MTSATFLLRGTRVAIRYVTHNDHAELGELSRQSEELHRPWVPHRETTPEAFAEYLNRFEQPTHEGFVICMCLTGEIVGAVNINNIVRGTLQSGTLGYVAFSSTTGRGYMTEGLGLVVRYAFEELGLHRLEANIQPANTRSSRLVERLGFRREGHSPAFQFIHGQWRDNDRWALIAPTPATDP